jgi:transcriptional regulator with XRE-family HTH domain
MQVNVRRDIDPAPTVGGRMKQLRLAAGLSQEHMRHVVKRSIRLVKAWEAGEAMPRLDDFVLWVRECGADVSEVLDGDPEVLFVLSGWITAFMAA